MREEYKSTEMKHWFHDAELAGYDITCQICHGESFYFASTGDFEDVGEFNSNGGFLYK